MFGWLKGIFFNSNKGSVVRQRLSKTLDSELFSIVNKQLNDEQIIVFDQMLYFIDRKFKGHKRERVLAMFFLALAYEHPNLPVYVFTHRPDERRRKDVIELLNRILANYPKVQNEIIVYDSSIMHQGK
jgi:hypothetical protein